MKKDYRVNFIIISISIILAFVIFFRSPLLNIISGTPKVIVPKEFILGDVIDSSSIKSNMPDPSKTDVVQYRTDRSPSELLSYYDDSLSKNGWKITSFTSLAVSPYQIVAENSNTKLRASIIIGDIQNSSRTVTIIFKLL